MKGITCRRCRDLANLRQAAQMRSRSEKRSTNLGIEDESVNAQSLTESQL